MAESKLKLKKDVAKEFLSGDDAYMSSIMTILYKVFGDRVFEEDPAILFKDIEDEFGCKLSEECENKINAAIVLMTTDKFFTDKTVFTAITLAINEGDIGGIPKGQEEEIDGLMVMWAMFEAGLLGDKNLDEMLSMMKEDVVDFADAQIASIAQDKEDIPDDVDTVEEAMDSNAFMDYLKRNIYELALQLERLGADKETLKEFLKDNDIEVEIV